MPFELLKSEPLFQGRAFKIRRDTLKTPGGNETKFDIVEHGGSVIVIPIDADGNMLFVRQYRHAAGMDLLELPAGTRNSGEPHDVCAAREMREETGMAAGKLEHIGDFYLAPGYSTEFMAVFLATELIHDPLEADEDEFLQVEKIPIKKAIEMAERGQMPDAKSLAALFLARPQLKEYL
ncbi:MAG: NUDIX hydrolase [Chloroflexi bacterium]|nr:NUDIX hydrolase [Chloroflexota bacterium]MBI1855599.1 NUDIX hydrolase [Chloroflexota bacterium]MBI3341217.1 NUDIX hydrolase [Chloroflexota bacterium]